MKILTLNIRGFGKDVESESKVNWFCKMCQTKNPDIVFVQESKCNTVDDRWVELIWGSSNVSYVQKPKIGKSGGLLIIWDPSIFVVTAAVEKRHFIAIKGKWKGKDNESIIVNVYGPHNDNDKSIFFDSLDVLLNVSNVDWIIGGDFNEVRFSSECQNSRFISRRACVFNDFIDRNQLIEIPLLGKRFTRISDDGRKLSKLDRFLVNESFVQTWGHTSVIALDRRTSDHCPLILRDSNIDFGPKPFKLFNIWLENKDVEKIIVDAWNEQNALRTWSKYQYGTLDEEIENWQNITKEMEEKADSGSLNDDDRTSWINARAI
ncbi:uncharacterized protein [Rutidosis leptorrhynchoides]|uniref:uncharacterized protein n=1 Tax=Rutidosis leptorrhynchoides TaxID=125765 RepID=UPI003A9A5903